MQETANKQSVHLRAQWRRPAEFPAATWAWSFDGVGAPAAGAAQPVPRGAGVEPGGSARAGADMQRAYPGECPTPTPPPPSPPPPSPPSVASATFPRCRRRRLQTITPSPPIPSESAFDPSTTAASQSPASSSKSASANLFMSTATAPARHHRSVEWTSTDAVLASTRRSSPRGTAAPCS